MEKIILEAKNIHKSYKNGEKKLDVLNGFALELREKEIITITGQSGCGKSTALNILGTLDLPDSGNIIIENKRVDGLNNKQLSILRNKSIGFVFQFHYLLPEFSALENVLIPTWIKDKLSNSDYAESLFSDLGLSSKLDSFPNQLSGGERARIALIRGIVNKPRILFADEPTGNLDEANASNLIQLLMKINEKYNQAIVITTHNPKVAKIGNKKFKLEKGKLS